jgi:Cysteine rich repeat
MMKNVLFVLVLGVVLMFGTQVLAAENVIDTVAKGCKTELDTYCKNVTPGEGRVLACLYAFSDKLSGQCEYALYDAAAQLERALTALTYVANECRDDLQKYCANIKPGEGRLLACMDKNEKQVSSRCKQALKDTGLKK